MQFTTFTEQKRKTIKLFQEMKKKLYSWTNSQQTTSTKKKKNPTANVICYGLWLNVFSGRMGQREGCSRPSLLINKKGKILVMVGTHVKQRI